MLYKELVEYADRAGADPLHVGGLGLTRVTAAYTAAVTPEGPPPLCWSPYIWTPPLGADCADADPFPVG